MKNFEEKLAEFTQILTADLQLVAQKNFALEDESRSGEVATLIFEYFFPLLEISFYATNADDDQLGYKELIEGQGMLKSLPEEELAQLAKERDLGSKIYQELGTIFARWFAGIWQESGASSLDIPAFLLTDDDRMMKFDLNNRKWLKDEDYK